jgi:hypothetical protein
MPNLISERTHGQGKDILERVYYALLDMPDFSLENWKARQTIAGLLHQFPSRIEGDEREYSDEVEGDYGEEG